jgi:hypothetical protein
VNGHRALNNRGIAGQPQGPSPPPICGPPLETPASLRTKLAQLRLYGLSAGVTLPSRERGRGRRAFSAYVLALADGDCLVAVTARTYPDAAVFEILAQIRAGAAGLIAGGSGPSAPVRHRHAQDHDQRLGN